MGRETMKEIVDAFPQLRATCEAKSTEDGCRMACSAVGLQLRRQPILFLPPRDPEALQYSRSIAPFR